MRKTDEQRTDHLTNGSLGVFYEHLTFASTLHSSPFKSIHPFLCLSLLFNLLTTFDLLSPDTCVHVAGLLKVGMSRLLYQANRHAGMDRAFRLLTSTYCVKTQKDRDPMTHSNAISTTQIG